ncbi:MAG: branched-chain amino acid ABC transporter substrate-binding protein [Chloroflexi bacterium]|nr:branched-chain amino acid ABC transporter substrate-binding protein [Chloroflexota bacterium]
MKGYKILSVVVLAGLILSLSVGCGQAPAAKGTIKVYASWPMQGAMIPEGTAMLNAAKLAIEEVKGEVAGYKLELVFLDDASPTTGSWDGTIEAGNAQKAIADESALVYFGTYNSGAAKISMPLTNKANMAHITPANTYPGLTRAVPGVTSPGEPGIYRPTGKVNYFRTHGADDLQGAAGAAWAKCLGITKVYILDDRQLYGKGIADAFEKRAKELGLTVLGHDGIESVNIDFRALLTKVKATAPELVYAGVLVDSGGPQIAMQMDALGMFKAGTKLMSEDAMYSDAVFAAAPAAVYNNNLYVTFPGLPPDALPTDVGKKFYSAYKAKYGSDPIGWSSYAYNSMLVIIDSVKRAAPKIATAKTVEEKRIAVLDAMRATKDFPGIIGPLTFDGNGDPQKYVMSGFLVKDGKYTFVEAISGDMTCKK